MVVLRSMPLVIWLTSLRPLSQPPFSHLPSSLAGINSAGLLLSPCQNVRRWQPSWRVNSCHGVRFAAGELSSGRPSGSCKPLAVLVAGGVLVAAAAGVTTGAQSFALLAVPWASVLFCASVNFQRTSASVPHWFSSSAPRRGIKLSSTVTFLSPFATIRSGNSRAHQLFGELSAMSSIQISSFCVGDCTIR